MKLFILEQERIDQKEINGKIHTSMCIMKKDTLWEEKSKINSCSWSW